MRNLLLESGRANPWVPGARISSDESRSRAFPGRGGVWGWIGGLSGGGGGMLEKLGRLDA